MTANIDKVLLSHDADMNMVLQLERSYNVGRLEGIIDYYRVKGAKSGEIALAVVEFRNDRRSRGTWDLILPLKGNVFHNPCSLRYANKINHFNDQVVSKGKDSSPTMAQMLQKSTYENLETMDKKK